MENINFRKKMHGITENKKPGGLESLHLLFFLFTGGIENEAEKWWR